ncbi:membrane or secreted protein [Pedobacter sp. BAL39]|uniref:membrane or secreted protein n=1 Tax=Pedobacter sp. BAL39 TaxID=391596 RepID=UPI0012FA24F3|nr:membrane or secreted protein [Pedobacter sp. BAL39]
MFLKSVLVFLSAATFSLTGFAQAKNAKTGIFVDKQGVMRWQKDGSEAAFFGTNYTAPFAYGYRSIQRTGTSVEQAIKDDVYHFSRLGLDAFRVHVWDVEISDSVGNLINNEHLRLFDFLIAELKKRKIKTLITPIAFWGNGYPEKDEDRGSFSSKYGKQKALTEEAAFQAQERYLKQFFRHKNPYTGLTYQNDPDIIAAEVNNEPQHSGAKALTTTYINRMVKAIRSTGWSKPVFYNISESPKYADAIVKANVQGHSFQWYPTGLVSGHTLKGNYLPHVAKYEVPFDSIPGFKNRAKMVYEFDAGDVMDSYMYPAMAKSFRVAGFQWATQFAYDPMATAQGNTEYQTHYLNMAYTPSKAISLLIASKAFHLLPRAKQQTSDTLFGAFRLSRQASLSEMNTEEEFYYSNTTTSTPVDASRLKHIAGVGSSALIKYTGTGIYMADKIGDGVWRLEVMPDAIALSDPFERTSPDKVVTAIRWSSAEMQLGIADLGLDFDIKGLNASNGHSGTAAGGEFSISPGTYLLTRKGIHSTLNAESEWADIRLGEFVAPSQTSGTAFVLFDAQKDADRMMVYNPDWKHRPVEYPSAGKPFVKFNMPADQSIAMLGFQSYFGDRLPGMIAADTLVIRARATDDSVATIQIGVIDTEADFFAAKVELSKEFKSIKIPFSTLKPSAQLLLPRPYPGFQTLYRPVGTKRNFNPKLLEKLEVTFGKGIEISTIYLK